MRLLINPNNNSLTKEHHKRGEWLKSSKQEQRFG